MTVETDENTPMEGVTPKRGKTITREELVKMIKDVENLPLEENQKWYIISQKWWSKVVKATKDGYPEDIPAIDCSDISQKGDNGSFFLKPKLNEGADFTYVPSLAFLRLRDIYGLSNEQRDVIERITTMKDNRPVLEAYPRIVNISLASDSKENCSIQLNGDETMSDVRDSVLQRLRLTDVPLDHLRFYIATDGDYELIDSSQQNINSYFDTAQKVVVDVKQASGWFIGSSSNKPKTSGLYGLSSSHATNIPGVCGLQNLGNTCFMASAIQCLSNVPGLTDYFASEAYVRDINETNPLGTKGELARAYGDLIQQMWSGENSYVVPRKLKAAIGNIAPRFCGYAQQDAQELLAFLLDGLHEDLNRIINKPYIEEQESADMEEHEAAEKAWQMYKARNDSVVVDKFHGQLKSTLVCPVCEKVSVKFDPFCFLSLPLPPKDRAKLLVTLMFNESPRKKWAKFAINVHRSSTTASDVIACVRRNIEQNTGDMNGSGEAKPLNLVLFSVGDQSDDVLILQPDTIVMTDRPRGELFAAQIDHPVENAHIVVVKNQANVGRVLSLPMIFSLPKNQAFARSFIVDKALTFTKEAFLPDYANGNIIADGSEVESKEPYTILHQTNDSLLPLTDDSPIITESSLLKIVFRWNQEAKFNGYRGIDLIEREVSVTQKKDIHLTDCIDLFTKKEQLGEDDLWYCPRCKKHERATKKLELWNLPEVLIIHLKRFQYSRYHRDKIDTPVVIPVKGFELNSKLANERHEHVLYDLIGFSNHHGGLGGGHYTATALNSRTMKWHDFNDSCAGNTSAPPDPYPSTYPYLLVYQRREVRPDHADANMEMETD